MSLAIWIEKRPQWLLARITCFICYVISLQSFVVHLAFALASTVIYHVRLSDQIGYTPFAFLDANWIYILACNRPAFHFRSDCPGAVGNLWDLMHSVATSA